jgi:hypothetical protein
MANLLTTGVGWLSTALKASAGTAGVYRRTSTDESATLTVTAGRTDREQTTDRNLVNVVGSDDILVSAGDFEAAFGLGIRPEDGDRWECGGRVYRVRPLGGEPAWRKADPGGVMLRVHLKDYGPDEGTT